MNKNRKRYSKKTGIRAMALSIAAAMAVTLYPIPAFAVENGQQSRQRYRIKPEETFMIMENREMIRRHRMWMNLQL